MGRIAAIKRMAVHDGPGLRTTLFLKGCPLRCHWCHNPECISPTPEIAYIETKCLNCGECISLCTANQSSRNGHVFHREVCTGCGKCSDICLGGAFTFYGKDISVQQAVELLLQDRAFYESSGGGITVSGGEPLMQAEFTTEILRTVHDLGIHTALDTCGFASRDAIEFVLPWVDLFLYDLKAASPEVHKTYTGQDNRIIIDNLRYICAAGKRVEIRIPYVPGMNDCEIPGIAAILQDLNGIEMVRVLPYHHYAASKYTSLGLKYGMPVVSRPDREEMAKAVEQIKAFGLQVVDGGNLP